MIVVSRVRTSVMDMMFLWFHSRKESIVTLAPSNEINRPDPQSAIRTFFRDMPPRQKRQYGKTSDPGLARFRRFDRAVRSLMPSQIRQTTIDCIIDLDPFFFR